MDRWARQQGPSGLPSELARFERYQEDILGFFRDVLGIPVAPDRRPVDPWAPYLWPHQRAIAEAVWQHRRVAVASCNSIGKDFIAARIAVAFLCCFEDAIVVTTGPTDRQVRHLLWGEIHRAKARARLPLPGQLDQQRWEINERHYALGFKSKDADPERFHGFHSRHILYIVDEASGVPEAIYEGIEGGMASGDARLLLIGNPTQPSGKFHAAFHQEKRLYHTIQIAATDTPNFQGRQGLIAPYLISPQWAEERRVSWGEDSALYEVRVLGRFPSEGIDTLFPLAWVQAAQQRREGVDVAPLPTIPPVHIGVDVARFGDDESALCARRGRQCLMLEAWAKRDVEQTAVRTAEAIARYRAGVVRVDVIGVGAGVADALRRMQREGKVDARVRVQDVNVAEEPHDPEKYRHRRDEVYDSFRQRLADGDVTDLPDDDTLVTEMTPIKYGYNARGQMEVESKDSMKRRKLKSPDRTEAVLLAYLPDQAGVSAARDREAVPRRGSGDEYFGAVHDRVF